MEEATAQLDGIEVDYCRWGSGDNAVILLHSLGLERTSWDRTAGHLMDGRTVFALDMPGHGTSEKPGRLLTLQDYAGLVAQFVEKVVAADSASLVGNSFGSLIGLEVAASHAHVVDRLALVGCPAWPSREARQDWLHARSEALLDDDGEPRPVSDEMVETLFGAYDDTYAQILRRGFGSTGTWLRNTMWAIYAYDCVPSLPKIDCPVLVTYGERDWLKDTAPTIQQALPDHARQDVADGSHLVPVDKPDELARALAGFLPG